ncbi:MAG: universal stress protein, partial [Nakamurella sp.]
MNRQVDNVVVFGVDGSAPSTAAALWAAEEAQRRGATLRL